MRCVASLLLLAGCLGGGSSPDDDDDGTMLVGECEPAAGASELAATATSIASFDHCLQREPAGVLVVESQLDWDNLFAGCEASPPDVPAGIDFATQRAAIAVKECTPLDFRFAAEAPGEVVIGVLSRVSGACLPNLLVVPLERSTKPVRLAECREECPDCPPVP